MADNTPAKIRVMLRDHVVDSDCKILLSVAGVPGKFVGTITGKAEIALPMSGFDEACRAIDERFREFWPNVRVNGAFV
jgi:hypothetical protein